MKNLKIIFGGGGVALVFALLALSFASCSDPETEADPTKSHEISLEFSSADETAGAFYNYLGGPQKTTLTITEGGILPGNGGLGAYKAPTPFPSAQGLYPYQKPIKWEYKEGNSWKDLNIDAKVMTELTIRPKAWSNTSTAVSGVSTIQGAVSTVNSKSEPYIFVLAGTTQTVTSSLDLKGSGLYIHGNSNTSISLTTATGTKDTGALFTISGSTSSLILGNNITLDGGNAKTTPDPVKKAAAILVKEGAVFTMKSGSTITNFKSNGSGFFNNNENAAFGAAAVHVDGATFNMEGGSITSNENAYKDSSNKPLSASAGAVYAESSGRVNLTGGSIKNNKVDTSLANAGTNDVYITNSTFLTLGKNVEIGQVCISATTTHRVITLSDFTGTVAALNLRVGTTDSTATNAQTYWQGSTGSTGPQITTGGTAGNGTITMGYYFAAKNNDVIQISKTLNLATGSLQ